MYKQELDDRPTQSNLHKTEPFFLKINLVWEMFTSLAPNMNCKKKWELTVIKANKLLKKLY